MSSKRLCVVTTHPVQYIAPWFRSLDASGELDLEVIFFRELVGAQQGVGFGKAFSWDVPLREGYRSHVLDVPSGWRYVPALLRRLHQKLKYLRPDAVLVTGWNEPGLLAASPLIRAMGLPIIMRGESNVLSQRALGTRTIHALLLKCSSAAVSIGSANRAFYLQNGFEPHRVYPGAYFVETERMLAMARSHAHQRMDLRRECGFAPDDFVFCFVGKHVPFKRPGLLIEAAAMARRSCPNIKLLFAGSGELTDSLRSEVKRLAVPAYFTGFLNQTELWRAYVPSDAFVLPSTNRETWGLVTNEAMLFGLPVIVSDSVGCGPDLVMEEQTGYIFSGGAEGLARRMEQLVADPEKARRMGGHARSHVESHFSMLVASRGLMEAFDAVAN